jgi:RHS repeat-associated protein
MYDADGEVTATIDPLGKTTTTLYDADGEVTATIDPRGYTTTTLYDADGEVTAIIDPDGNLTTRLYDADGEVTATIDPLGHRSTTMYDADGEVIETIDPLGRITTSVYDAEGRLVGQTWYDSHHNRVNTESFTYDAVGNLLTAQDVNGTYTMTYDALNRLVTTQDPYGLTLTYTYDANNNRTQVQDSLGGVTTYGYDADNELASERFGGTGQTPLRVDLTHDADGEVLTETRFSDLAGTQVVVESFYTYDSDGEITSLVDQDGRGHTVANFTDSYDNAGRVTSEINLGMTTTYAYDGDSQLIGEVSPLATINYSYDAAGPRTGGNNVVGPDNRLRSDGTWNYTYDAAGNLIQKVGIASGPDHGLTWTYAYNNRNQMTSAVETQGSTTLESVTFKYDVFGNRLEEDLTSGGTTQVTRFAYDGQNVWADLDGSNKLVMRRLFLTTVDSVTARITASGTVAWYLTDRLGSVRVLTDATGAGIDIINHDGFGDVISESSAASSDRYLFTGREFDRVTGLQYNRARYYDPTTGRWTTEDSAGFGPGMRTCTGMPATIPRTRPIPTDSLPGCGPPRRSDPPPATSAASRGASIGRCTRVPSTAVSSFSISMTPSNSRGAGRIRPTMGTGTTSRPGRSGRGAARRRSLVTGPTTSSPFPRTRAHGGRRGRFSSRAGRSSPRGSTRGLS